MKALIAASLALLLKEVTAVFAAFHPAEIVDWIVAVTDEIVLLMPVQMEETVDWIAERTVESALYDDTSIYNRGKGQWYQRLHVIGNAFRYSWKYRDVAHYSMIGYVWQFVYGFLRRND